MKKFLVAVLLLVFSNSFAQVGHTLQIDDAAGNRSIIKPSSTGGTYTLPPNGGTLVSSSVLSFADFYALMPGDNPATVAIGAAVQFPQNGPADGSGSIGRTGPSTFNLSAIGTYEVNFQVSVNEPGQLTIRLNGAILPYTTVGRATGTSQISGTCLVTTAAVNSILEVVNASSPVALTVTPVAGGVAPVSAHLVIKRLQ
jgi:hypothetical protein